MFTYLKDNMIHLIIDRLTVTTNVLFFPPPPSHNVPLIIILRAVKISVPNYP